MAKIADPHNEVEDAFVPLYLRIVLCVCRALCATPATLRRTRTGWRVSVSPSLVKLQRLMRFVTSILGLSAYTYDFFLDPQYRVRMGKTSLTISTCIIEAILLVLAYNVGMHDSPRQLRQTVTMLQEIIKIKTTIMGTNTQSQYSKIKHVLFISYITWQLWSYFILFCAQTIYLNFDRNLLGSILYTVIGYHACVATFMQLECSAKVTEIYSTLTLLNNELEFLLKYTKEAPLFRECELKTNNAKNNGFKKGYATNPRFVFTNAQIRQMSLGFDSICQMLRETDNNNGPFMAVYFLMMFLHSLKSPYNLIVVLQMTNVGALRYWYVAQQINWLLVNFCHLVTIVEPCHWLQEEKERTSRLLTALAGQAHRYRLDSNQLSAFLLQTEMLSFSLGPCGVFAIRRPLLASFVGGIVTYLIIMVQFQTITETL